jgi:hypothetical protein
MELLVVMIFLTALFFAETELYKKIPWKYRKKIPKVLRYMPFSSFWIYFEYKNSIK